DGMRCRFHRSAVTDESSDATPGTVTSVANGALSVATGDRRVLQILEMQPEGKRVMPVRDFLSGHSVSVGTSLT
nr:methionyl-tRNA formyltransferase [Acidobacteriota bacterium]